MYTFLLSWMLVLGAPGDANTNWATSMFETTSHDFGVVMKGSKTEYDFVFTNKYNEDVQIESVTTSCQCTMPEFTRGPIKTWEKGSVKIMVNTKSFVGTKNATLTVRFSKPFRMEIQLHSYVNIRSDVAVNPGVVYFGTVSQGKSPSIPVTINCVGRRNWQITDIQSTCPFLTVQLKENNRFANQVSYLMTVSLKENAPAGRFSEFLELVTNDPDPRNRRFPIQVEGRVRQPLSVNPSPLSFGLVEIGETVTKALVVEGQEPFKINDIRSDDPHITATIHQMTPTRYTVRMRYRGDKPRAINGNVTLITDVDGGTTIPLGFMGRIMEPEHPAAPVNVEPEIVEDTLPHDDGLHGYDLAEEDANGGEIKSPPLPVEVEESEDIIPLDTLPPANDPPAAAADGILELDAPSLDEEETEVPLLPAAGTPEPVKEEEKVRKISPPVKEKQQPKGRVLLKPEPGQSV